MEEIGRSRARSTLDDLIVRLHTRGETFFQAIARAANLPGVDRRDSALLTEVPEGRVPLASGRTIDVPPFDASGEAAISTFELEQASYETRRMLVTEPEPPREPRLDSETLWPALRADGYRVGHVLDPIGPHFTPRRLLAEPSGVHPRMIDRVCAGAQKTISITTAIAILEEVRPHPLLDELKAELNLWETAMYFYYYDRFEYLEKLGVLAQQLLTTAGFVLTPTELTALRDIGLLLREAHREPSTPEHVLTAEERLEAADRCFRESLGRDPVPLSPRLRQHAIACFRADRNAALGRQRALHKGLKRPVITTASVYARTHRLRRSGRLPAKSKPAAFQPPADFLDIFGDTDRPQRGA